MQAITQMPFNIVDTTGDDLGLSTVLFLMSLVQQTERGRKLDIIYTFDDCTFTVHKDTILTTLDEAPDHQAWDKLHTIWEQMDMRGVDFMECKIA